MLTTKVRVAAAIAVPLLALAACSSGSSGESAGSSDASSRSVAKGAPPGGSAADLSGGATAVEGAAAPATGSTSNGKASSDAAAGQPDIEQPAIISTGSIALTAKDVARARSEVQQVADSYRGMVSDEETSTADDGRMGQARMVLRIPAASFAQAMADLEKVAHLVDSSTTSDDVSTQVIDVDERVKAARASIDRIRLLLSRAEKIGDIMAIESELSSREADLNSLLRQQAHLQDQTALSTITVSIERPPLAAKTRHVSHATGFAAGLSAGWDALRGFATGVAVVVGAVLPWIPVALLIGIPVWLVLRRSRRGVETEPKPEQSQMAG
ncbi:DUF4349 domain-containing protein [Nocardioides sp. AN3]